MAVHGRAHPAPAVISRGSLADPPDLLKRAPVVISGARDRLALAVTAGQGTPVAAVISRSSLADAAPPAAAAPAPLVIAAAAPPTASPPALIYRGSLADAPVLTTPGPVVVAQPVRWPPTFPVISSAPFIPPPPPFSVARSAAAVTPAATSASTVS